MSKKAVILVEKELPPIVSATVYKITEANSYREQPRTYEASERSVPDLPELYYSDGLCARVLSQTIPELQTGEGLERNYEGLETKLNGYDPPTLAMKDGETMSLSSKSKRRRCGLIFAAVGVLIALAAGLGGGLGARWSNSQRNTQAVELFNATTPLPRSDVAPNDWRDDNTAEGEAYHGYWQQNIFALNSHFGTISDLQALASALHARNMFLMVDVVVNHFGWAGNGRTVDYTKMYPFDNRKYYHPYCVIMNQDYLSNQTAVEQCWLGDEQTYGQWISSLVSVFGIDGLRIDTVKHVEKSFWSNFKSAAGIYTLGEVFDGAMNYTCPYQEQLDGLLDYPLYYPLIRAFQDSNGSMASLGTALTTIQDSCRDPTLLATFSENHDIPRFLSQRNDMNAQMNIIVFTILSGGIPIIYQGQEQGFSGGNDPANREALWTSDYSTKTPLYMLIASVNQIRNHEVFGSPQYLTASTEVIYTDDHHIALQKGNIVSLYSNEGSNGSLSNITLKRTGFQENQPTIEILTCRNSTTDADGNLRVSVQEGKPQVGSPALKSNLRLTK
ncbi:MAG: hypothetical protein Q9204_001869 [Flavoplaca sp. TL-2023a]